MEGNELVDLANQMLMRRIIWDVTPCNEAEAVCAMMGLSSTSAEVADAEHRAAHNRQLTIIPLHRFLETICSHLANLALTRDTAEGATQLDADEIEAVGMHYASLIGSGVVSTLVELIDAGLISINPNALVVAGVM